MSNLTIGAFVRARRKANLLTQQGLAELAGVGKRFVSEIERGKKTARIDATNQVLAVFGKTLGVIGLNTVDVDTVELPPEDAS